jgi:hypothetical protein
MATKKKIASGTHTKDFCGKKCTKLARFQGFIFFLKLPYLLDNRFQAPASCGNIVAGF